MMIVLTLYFFLITVFAQSNNIKTLMDKIDEKTTKDIIISMEKIYKNRVLPILLKNKIDLIYSNVSDQAITNATFSPPIPILSSNVKYNKGEDFKSKLRHSGWLFIAYADSKPMAMFHIEKQGGEFVVSNIMNENFAKASLEAINQLNSKSHVVMPVSGYYFMADTDDNVSIVKPQNSSFSKYNVKTFEEFNKAVNKTIDYYSNQSETSDGGSVLIEYLYSSSQTKPTIKKMYSIIIVICISCLTSMVIIFKKTKLKLIAK